MTSPDQANAADRPNLLSLIPGGARAGKDEMAVAILVAGSIVVLYGFRKGFKGIGQLQLNGSAIRGVEFAAYLVVVGAAFRTLQTRFPESSFARAINFVY